MESLLKEYTRNPDGYLNATDCCRLYRKRWIKFKSLSSTKRWVQQARLELGSSVLLFEITYGRCGTTWLHPYLIPHFIKWLRRENVKGNEEACCQERLASSLGGEVEVETPVGRIDVLTTREVIEIKAAKDWKEGVGKVLVYSTYYPLHQRRIHLFGEASPAYRRMVKEHCFKFGVRVTWE